MFNIPLDQVCPPGLHISLGTFLKFFNLLEEAAHNIDLAFAEKHGETISNVFTNIRARIKVLQLSIEHKEQKIELVKDAAANAILAQPENEKVIRDIYEPRLKHLNEQVVTKLTLFLYRWQLMTYSHIFVKAGQMNPSHQNYTF